MNHLTNKQQEIFDFIIASFKENGYIPTVREITSAFGFASTNATNSHLIALEKKGYISKRPGSARGIEIAPDFLQDTKGIAIVGKVAAGSPITAIENLEGYLELENIYDNQTHYALKINGDSMIDAGLWNGDYVIVRQQNIVESGQIGVAVIDEEATIKKFNWINEKELELIPANENYKTIKIVISENFRVAGKVVGLYRMIK